MPVARTKPRFWFYVKAAIQRTRAPTLLLEQLYPPLLLDVCFRPYVASDFEDCIRIYKRNEVGRFPEGGLADFRQYLERENKTLMVAEFNGNPVGFGGIDLNGPRVAVLCFGMVDPDYQRQRIGASLTLLRFAQIPPQDAGVYALIMGVHKSMPIYKRYGFVQTGTWKSKDGFEHPIGVKNTSAKEIKSIRTVLAERGIKIEGDMRLYRSGTKNWIIQPDENGMDVIKLEPESNEP